MTFSISGKILNFEKSGDRYFKVLVQELNSNRKILLTISKEHEQYLINGEIIHVVGQANANEFQSKWYNNLFVNTFIPNEERFLLLKEIPDSNPSQFAIVDRNSDPFSDEYIEKISELVLQQNLDDLSAENSTNPNLSFLLKLLRGQKPSYCNVDHKHLLNSVSNNLIKKEGGLIELEKETSVFYKIYSDGKSRLLFFCKRNTIDDIIPLGETVKRIDIS